MRENPDRDLWRNDELCDDKMRMYLEKKTPTSVWSTNIGAIGVLSYSSVIQMLLKRYSRTVTLAWQLGFYRDKLFTFIAIYPFPATLNYTKSLFGIIEILPLPPYRKIFGEFANFPKLFLLTLVVCKIIGVIHSESQTAVIWHLRIMYVFQKLTKTRKTLKLLSL